MTVRPDESMIFDPRYIIEACILYRDVTFSWHNSSLFVPLSMLGKKRDSLPFLRSQKMKGHTSPFFFFHLRGVAVQGHLVSS